MKATAGVIILSRGIDIRKKGQSCKKQGCFFIFAVENYNFVKKYEKSPLKDLIFLSFYIKIIYGTKPNRVLTRRKSGRGEFFAV